MFLLNDGLLLSMMHFCFSVQHNRFVSDSKGKEPDVLFVGDSLVQLMHEFEVWFILLIQLHRQTFVITNVNMHNLLIHFCLCVYSGVMLIWWFTMISSKFILLKFNIKLYCSGLHYSGSFWLCVMWKIWYLVVVLSCHEYLYQVLVEYLCWVMIIWWSSTAV